jgi:hypothetical protein
MKYLYSAIMALLLSACAIQQPEPIRVDTEKYPLDTGAIGISTFITNKARGDYKRYAKMKYHKAFAQSSSGSWSWWAGRTSAAYAMQDALDECRKYNKEYEAEEPCMIINLDGYWGAELH